MSRHFSFLTGFYLQSLLGGSTLYIETVLKKSVDLESKDPGNLEVTGNLGNVMKESIQLAYTFAKSYLHRVDPKNMALEKGHIHLHVPEVMQKAFINHLNFVQIKNWKYLKCSEDIWK